MPDEPVIEYPHSTEAEQALIGAAILDGESITTLTVTGDDFYLRRNGLIWDAIRALTRRGEPVDHLTLSHELDRAEKLDYVGGRDYLIKVVNATVDSTNIEGYASIVQEKARRRRVIQICNHAATDAYNQEASIDAIVSKAAGDLVTACNASRGAVPIGNYADMVIQAYEKAHESPSDVYGIRTGLGDFDRITGGMQPSTEMILSGDPGLGKTILGMQFCSGMADATIGNAPGSIYSLEMSGESLARRSISAFGRIPTRKVRSGNLTDEEYQAFQDGWGKLCSLPVYLDDSPYWTTITLKADLARLKDRAGIQWFMVDYLDLLRDQYGKDDTERTKHISGELHAICRDLKLFGLVIHTMNKAGVAAGEKGKASLAGSVKVIYDADDIWIITRPDEHSQNIRLERKKGREADMDINTVDLVKVPGGYPMFGQKLRVGQILPEMWSAK